MCPSAETSKIAEIQLVYQCAEEIMVSCQELFNVISRALDMLRQRRIDLNDRLCDVLAKNRSVRKKDSEKLIEELNVLLDEKERKAREEVSSFLEDQKSFALILKDIVLGSINVSSPDFVAKGIDIEVELEKAVKVQGHRKIAVVQRLTDFQTAYSRIVSGLEFLLRNGDSIRISDIKEIRNMVDREWCEDEGVRSATVQGSSEGVNSLH